MSQVTEYATPGSPLTMVELAAALDNMFAAVASQNKGTVAPDNPFAGMLWIDSSVENVETLKLYADAAWKTLFSINIATGVITLCRNTDGTALASAFALTLLDDADAADVLATLGVATATLTLTNKRVTKRVTSIVSAAEPTINTNNCDYVEITALAAAITSMTANLSGTPTKGQTLWINIVGTDTRAIAWGASFEGTLLPDEVASGKRLDVGLVWNNITSKWRCISVNHE